MSYLLQVRPSSPSSKGIQHETPKRLYIEKRHKSDVIDPILNPIITYRPQNPPTLTHKTETQEKDDTRTRPNKNLHKKTPTLTYKRETQKKHDTKKTSKKLHQKTQSRLTKQKPETKHDTTKKTQKNITQKTQPRLTQQKDPSKNDKKNLS